MSMGDQQTTTTPGGDPPADSTTSDTQTTPAAGVAASDQPRTFTQADLDRIVADRLTRERQKYSDYADLKDRAKKWQEHEDAQKTELEKAQAAAAQAEARQAQALATANDRLIRAAFLAEAAKVKAKHPQDAYNLADLATITVTEAGEVLGAAEAVKALVDAGRLVMDDPARPTAPNLDGGAGGGQRPGGKAVALTPEQLEVARKMGLTPEQYQKSLTKKQP